MNPWRGWRTEAPPLFAIVGLVAGMYLIMETSWVAIGLVALTGALLIFALTSAPDEL